MLKEIRKKSGMTQEEAATYLGISRRTYLKYENNDDLQKTLKGQYMIDALRKVNLIDEEHGVLTIEKIKEVCTDVFKDYNIKYCYLFGSYAKGYAKGNSDIDLLVYLDEDNPLRFFELIEVLREKSKKRIDLLDGRHISEDKNLLYEILTTGVKIYG